jgi:hypothetical protein
MIFVRRDLVTIPQKLLDVAVRAQGELERLTTTAERNAFIKKKSHIWRAFGRYLSRMSYGKCWYSESPDPQSFFDVDHFRPKNEAKRSHTEIDTPGYEWLAFSWENFRYAANCSNRVSTNENSGVVDGKGSWFPLLAGSVKACWNNRCETNERPVLLDPVVQSDVDLIEVQSDGSMGPTRFAVGSAKSRVERSCELYGLNLPAVKAARMRVIREVVGMLDVLAGMLDTAADSQTPVAVADRQPISRQCNLIREKTRASSPYSRAVRATLFREGYAELCATPEDPEAQHAA